MKRIDFLIHIISIQLLHTVGLIMDIHISEGTTTLRCYVDCFGSNYATQYFQELTLTLQDLFLGLINYHNPVWFILENIPMNKFLKLKITCIRDCSSDQSYPYIIILVFCDIVCMANALLRPAYTHYHYLLQHRWWKSANKFISTTRMTDAGKPIYLHNNKVYICKIYMYCAGVGINSLRNYSILVWHVDTKCHNYILLATGSLTRATPHTVVSSAFYVPPCFRLCENF